MERKLYAWLGVSNRTQLTFGQLYEATVAVIRRDAVGAIRPDLLERNAVSVLYPRFVEPNAALFTLLAGEERHRMGNAVLCVAALDATLTGAALADAFLERVLQVGNKRLDTMIGRMYHAQRPPGLSLPEFRQRLARHNRIEQLITSFMHAAPDGRPPAGAVRLTSARIAAALNGIGDSHWAYEDVAALRAAAPLGLLTSQSIRNVARDVNAAVLIDTRR